MDEEDSAGVGVPLLFVSPNVGPGAAGQAAAGLDEGNPARRKIRLGDPAG
jgi:hypothetical protein